MGNNSKETELSAVKLKLLLDWVEKVRAMLDYKANGNADFADDFGMDSCCKLLAELNTILPEEKE